MSGSNFYRAFEDRYRGSRELIGQRLKVYLPFISPLQDLHKPVNAVDLGCGRGEWLELLMSNGFDAHGVDMDAGMLAACVERGFSVTNGDAIEYLKSLPNESQSIISGFHIVEHIPFDKLEELVIQSLRVLRPGGLLILETPNPENLVVGTSNFYLDPTHLRPIPPSLLAFLPEHHGFYRVKIVRLQESEALRKLSGVSLYDVFNGASPDYAVIAQKSGLNGDLSIFNDAFEMQYGLELESLAKRYDQKQQDILKFAEGALGITKSLEQIEELTKNLLRANEELANKKLEFDSLKNQTERYLEKIELMESQVSAGAILQNNLNEKLRSIEAYAQELVLQNDALHSSLSWRITSPLRILGSVFSSNSRNVMSSSAGGNVFLKFLNFLVKKIVEIFQLPISFLIKKVLQKNAVSKRINDFLISNLPGLHNQLREIAYKFGLIKPLNNTVSFRNISSHRTKSVHKHKSIKTGIRSKFVEKEKESSLDLDNLFEPPQEEKFDFDNLMKNLRSVDVSDISSFR